MEQTIENAVEGSSTHTLKKGNKKIINAWTFYDWANSSYPLVITAAIFPIYYETVTRSADGSDKVMLFGHEFINSEIYTYTVALSFVIVSLSAPILSGIADYSGNKKRFMQFFCYLGSLSCMSLFFFSKDHLAFGLLSIMLSSIGFWGSLVFYNAYLPEIAEPKDHDRISARGYSLGYFGSSLLLILNLVLIKVFGMPAKYAFLTVGIWWIGFAQITFARLPNNVYNRKPQGNVFLKGFRELQKVWGQMKHHKRLRRYLGAFFVYSMGVQTVMLVAVLFAKKEVAGMRDTDLIISVLLIQFIGMAGAYLFSFLSDKIGNIKALGVAILIWVGICTGTFFFVHTPVDFYIVAATVGLVMGGIQSLSRSTYSKLLPETLDHASFFSFYDVSEKVGIVIGTFSFGMIEGLTGGMRNSILALIVFFALGFLLLLRIPPKEKE